MTRIYQPRRSKLGNFLIGCFFGSILLILAFFLTGCETVAKRDPKVETVEVRTPVRVSCVPADFPAAPAGYADDKLATVVDPVERTLRRAAGLQERKARLAVVEPVLQNCR